MENLNNNQIKEVLKTAQLKNTLTDTQKVIHFDLNITLQTGFTFNNFLQDLAEASDNYTYDKQDVLDFINQNK